MEQKRHANPQCTTDHSDHWDKTGHSYAHTVAANSIKCVICLSERLALAEESLSKLLEAIASTDEPEELSMLRALARRVDSAACWFRYDR